MTIEPVAFFRSPLKEKFGVPRQAGLAPDLPGEVRFVPPYDAPDALRGLEGFDYCWLVWGFSLNPAGEFHATVRPPRLGGNERVGVFASRSPFRPNGLGLSCVRIAGVAPGLIRVLGADLADGTPIYDVKPYVTYADSHPGAASGFVDGSGWEPLEVVIPDDLAAELPSGSIEGLVQVLSQDPRPQYQEDPERVYGMAFGAHNVKFCVRDSRVIVQSVEKC
ncbi:MAG: tRNA (N6-threonylcarbamoyladenosine(37)-N6)-methyltransferase TrmO [Bacteroidales bacterium]|nr:tRNA (N6-threonylcarbamoyladenosine(37)-N6)-methyltransferase TrmO [Bacteroidales bacterium]